MKSRHCYFGKRVNIARQHIYLSILYIDDCFLFGFICSCRQLSSPYWRSSTWWSTACHSTCSGTLAYHCTAGKSLDHSYTGPQLPSAAPWTSAHPRPSLFVFCVHCTRCCLRVRKRFLRWKCSYIGLHLSAIFQHALSAFHTSYLARGVQCVC